MPCVFCGAKELTAEHVWPRWLARAAPAPKRQVLHHRRRIDQRKQLAEAPTRWSGPSYTVTVHAACAECNNGWMSDLEGATKPLLEPMLKGQVRILERERQALLATWAFKTCVMLEFTYPRERAIQQSQCEWLSRHRSPPREVTVWAARYRGTSLNTFYRHDVMQLRAGADEDATEVAACSARDRAPAENAPLPPPVAYGVTFGVRHLAFQVFGTTEPEHRFRHAGITTRIFEQVWPTRAAFTWPPSAAIDDTTLPRILGMFRDAPTRH
jgi:hypothetical protein